MGTESLPTVLVVDDHEPTGRAIARLISHAGYHGVHVDNGEAALRFMRGHRPALIVLDVMMPGMDGPEVLRRVREDPDTCELPVVMFSAVGDPPFISHMLSKGANDYWIKSQIDFAELKARLDRFIAPPPAVLPDAVMTASAF
jgi:CheY-like chemotaxis protein